MQSTALLITLVTATTGLLTQENPIRKITGMLEDMKAELERDAEAEAETFDKAMCICETGEKELSGVIDYSNQEIERLTHKIEKDSAEKTQMDKDIKIAEKDKVDTEDTLEESIAIREKEAAKFAEEEKTAMFSVDQLERALPLFKDQGSGAVLLQQSPRTSFALKKLVKATTYLNENKRDAVLNFLQGGAHASLTPAAQEIVGIMEAMKDEMSSDLAESRATEKNAVESFNSMKISKEEHLGLLMRSLTDKAKRSGSLALSLSEDKDSLEDTSIELANAEKYLQSLKDQCKQRQEDRNMRTKMRNDEIVAIGEAVKILTDDDALETFKKAVPSSLLQSRPRRSTYDAAMLLQRGAHKRVVRGSSRIQRSHRVAMVAKHMQPEGVQAGTQAAKVVNFMIDNMVETLHEDDVSDEHKMDFCQNETTVFTQLKADKEALHAELEKQIEELENELAQIKEDIKALEDDINALDQDVKDASDLRKKEHAEFSAQYSALSTAASLIDKATKRLEKFYSPNAAGAAFLSIHKARSSPKNSAAYRLLTAGFQDLDFVQLKQRKSAVDPIVLPDTPTTYQKKESGGVIGLMNTMKSDVVSDLREAEVTEVHAAKDYVVLMKESTESRAAFTKALHTKKADKADTEERLSQTKQTNDLTVAELKQIDLYLARLGTECDFLMRNFDERHSARVNEEEGLKGAESIVTKEDVPSHQSIENVYEEEHSMPEVDEHFPDEPMPVM
jgi:predicted  nucleic acid-binding Zn-ribbon protein